MHIKES